MLCFSEKFPVSPSCFLKSNKKFAVYHRFFEQPIVLVEFFNFAGVDLGEWNAFLLTKFWKSLR